MQWNACNINTKLAELTHVLAAEDVDILLVQETHLTAADPDPTISGYECYRGRNRTEMKGGGIITYFKKTINFERLAKNRQSGLEVSTLRVQLSRNKWIKLTNLYCRPPSPEGNGEVKFDTTLIPADKNSIILGDFNGHNELWDPFIKGDARGEEILDWSVDNDLTILNDGTATRFDRSGKGSDSAPDITLCGVDLSSRCEWRVGEAIGNSDHLPIFISVNVKVPHSTTLGAASRWKNSNVDWAAFTAKTEEEFENLKRVKRLKYRVQRFVGILSELATEIAGKTKP